MKALVSRGIAAFAVVTVLLGCGGGGGGDSTDPAIRAELTQPGPFKAGEAVPFEVSTENFQLKQPPAKTLAVPRHGGVDHGGDDHHTDDSLNPDATEGHYHVYLNDGEGADPHVTAWSTTGSFPLPADIASGTHSLRFELRDNSHVKVGPEGVLLFDVR